MTIQTTALQNTTKPSNSTKPVQVDTAVQTEKGVFNLLVECGKIERSQITVSDSLLTIAKTSSDVNTFLTACRNAEKAYKAISKANTIPRAWTQTKSDIKAMFSELSQFDNISQLKKVKNIQAAEKRKANKLAKTLTETDKVNTDKALTEAVVPDTVNPLSAKHAELANMLAMMPEDLASNMLDLFIRQSEKALKAVNDKPVTKAKPEAKTKAAAKTKATKTKAKAK